MVTYDNYYGINKTSDESKYSIILQKNLYPMLRYITGDNSEVDITTADYATYTNQFLLGLGMTQTEITALRNVFLMQD